MHLFAHIYRSYQRIAHAPANPFLLLEHASRLNGPGFLGNIHLAYHVHEQEDVSVGHLQRQDIDLGDSYRAQGFEEHLLWCGDKKQNHGRDAGRYTHGKYDCQVDSLFGDENALWQRKWSEMNSWPKVCQLNEGITREEDVEDHGKGDYACKDGNEEPDTLDEESAPRSC